MNVWMLSWPCSRLAVCLITVRAFLSLNVFAIGVTYCEVVTHLYRHLDPSDLQHPALLSALEKKPALGRAVESVDLTFVLYLDQIDSFSYPISSVEHRNPTAHAESIMRLTLQKAVKEAQDVNVRCLEVLRLCPLISTISCSAALDPGIFSVSYMEEYNPFPSHEDLAHLPFFSNLRHASFRDLGWAVNVEGWNWREFGLALKSSTALESLQVPAGSAILSHQYPTVTKLVVHEEVGGFDGHGNRSAFVSYGANFPALRSISSTVGMIRADLQLGSALPMHIASARFVRDNDHQRLAWSDHLVDWATAVLPQLEHCHTLSISIQRGYQTGDNTPAGLTLMFAVLASNALFSSALRRLQITIKPSRDRQNTRNDSDSNLIPASAYLPVFEANAFPNLQYFSMTTSTDKKNLALGCLGFPNDGTTQVPTLPESDFWLLDDFRKLVDASVVSHPDMVIEWNLESVPHPYVWTKIRCIKKEAGKIHVCQMERPTPVGFASKSFSDTSDETESV